MIEWWSGPSSVKGTILLPMLPLDTMLMTWNLEEANRQVFKLKKKKAYSNDGQVNKSSPIGNKQPVV